MVDLNSMLVISLAALAFFSFCCLIVVVPIALQLSRTLSSAQHLLDTINDDFEPAVKEIKQSVSSVRKAVQSGSETVKYSLGDASVLVVSSAYGVLAGIKEYVTGYKNTENGYNNNHKERS